MDVGRFVNELASNWRMSALNTDFTELMDRTVCEIFVAVAVVFVLSVTAGDSWVSALNRIDAFPIVGIAPNAGRILAASVNAVMVLIIFMSFILF